MLSLIGSFRGGVTPTALPATAALPLPWRECVTREWHERDGGRHVDLWESQHEDFLNLPQGTLSRASPQRECYIWRIDPMVSVPRDIMKPREGCGARTR